MKRLIVFLPLLAALGIGAAVLWGLDPERDPNGIPSVLIGQPVPEFDLPAVAGIDTPALAAKDLRKNEGPVLVNVFASWCVPCRAEHVVLSRMVAEDGLILMGINYKDKPEDAADWLDELGNPYARIGSDESGRAGIEWGISGVPETFIVDANGTVVFRYVGPIYTDKAMAAVREALSKASGGPS
uniref:DsbE family thiol:disulfide interchange protein n=1 Tax=Yoonia sp. TaxID=2212373 RepID=UPI004048A9F6